MQSVYTYYGPIHWGNNDKMVRVFANGAGDSDSIPG